MNLETFPELSKKLKGEISLIIRRLDSAVIRMERVTTLVTDHMQRGAYRLDLADGSISKIRLIPRLEEAVAAVILSRYLDPEYFPKVLDSQGSILLVEWIEGRPLTAEEWTTARVYQAAGIQARLHATELKPMDSRPDLSSLGFWWARLEKKVMALKENGYIKSPDAAGVLRRARVRSGNSVKVGIVHGDFCPENFLLRPSNSLAVIDLEILGVTAIPYGLGRTALRWPMSRRLRGLYLDHYGQFSSADEFLENFTFWMMLILVEALLFLGYAGLSQAKQMVKMINDAVLCEDRRQMGSLFGYSLE